MTDNLSEYADAALYEAENRWAADDDFYLAIALQSGGAVLDLACGTGRLAVTMAGRGLAVVGLDLVPAMLDYARARSGGERAVWLQGDVRHFDLGRRFRFAVMTSHAWQGLLSDEDQDACLAAVARHLEPGGAFAFETRNPPSIRRDDVDFTLWRSFRDPAGAWVETHTRTAWAEDGKLQHVALERRWPDGGKAHRSAITLRYTSAAELDRRLAAAGFRVEQRWGAFPPVAYEADNSPEIVTVARLVPA